MADHYKSGFKTGFKQARKCLKTAMDYNATLVQYVAQSPNNADMEYLDGFQSGIVRAATVSIR